LETGYTSDTYVDDDQDLESGVRYEYEVKREGNPPGGDNNYPARIFTCVDQPIEVMEDRGKVLVIVDEEVYSGISTKLGVFTTDLIGDGWTVELKTDAPRHDDSWIACNPKYKSDPDADAANEASRDEVKDFIDDHPDAEGIILVGHVAIPYSGYDGGNPDGHGDHEGAWPADTWYGHSGSGWTDTLNTNFCATFPANYNLADDGKFDEYKVPNPSELTQFVGRIDFARLWSFGTSNDVTQAEIDLINDYFDKNHAYRIKDTDFDSKAMPLGNFNLEFYENSAAQSGTPYEHAFRNFSPLFGSDFDKIVVGDAYHQKSDSYLWGLLSGSGGPSLISENQPGGPAAEGPFLEHSTDDLADTEAEEAKIGFYLLLGSYFMDWNLGDNFLRATIATPTYGMAAAFMSPNPTGSMTHWQFQSLALGDPIGQGLLQTIQNGVSNSGDLFASLSIIGDPTLRMNMIDPPSSASCSGGSLTWTASEDTNEYYVYHAADMDSTFTNYFGSGSVTGTSATVSSCSGVFMVRAAKEITTGSATYLNLSQGAFYEH